jgi:hypothetical protein
MDDYQKLRPLTEIEACECPSVSGLFLVDLLTDNPLHCDQCRREVDPERLQLTARETGMVADWFSAENALYRLWLHSGEYEQYAKQQLLDIAGQVNRDGLEIAEMLSSKIPTKLWLFYDSDDGIPLECPRCAKPLDENVEWGTGKCESCRIQM